MMTAIACIKSFQKERHKGPEKTIYLFCTILTRVGHAVSVYCGNFCNGTVFGVISLTVFWKNDQNEKFGWFWLTGGGWGAMVSKKRISEPTRPEIGFFNSKHSDVKLIVQSSTHKVNSFMSRVPWYVDCQEGVTWGGEIIRWNWAVIGWTPSLSLATISSSSLSSPAKSSSNPLIDKHLRVCCA